MTITGTNFNEVSAVKFGSAAAASFEVSSEGTIKAVSPAGASTVDVTVTSSGGTSSTSGADHFTYSTVPRVTSVTPHHGPPEGGTAVTINGTSLTGATSVEFGSTEATRFKVESETKITAVAPAFTGGDDSVPIFVTTPGGTNEYICGEGTIGFIYEPTVTSVEPHVGPEAGGTEVTIRGAAFNGVIFGKVPLCTLITPVVQWVDFGSMLATSVNIVSESEVTAFAPPGTGTVNVTIDAAPPVGSSPIGAGDGFSYGSLISQARPTLTAIASPAISLGASVHDNAALAGGQSPGGAITFKLYGPNDESCLSEPVFTSIPVAVSGNGAYESPAFTPSAAGTYRWAAGYSGDASNEAASTVCGGSAESVAVAKASPTLTTTASPAISLGASVHDTAALAGGQRPTGGLTFRLYGPNDKSCSNPPAFTSSPVTIGGDGTYESPTFTPSAPGDYRWTASYSGDASNEGVASACEESSEQVTIRVRPIEVPASVRRLRWSFGRILGRHTVLAHVGGVACSRGTLPRIQARIKERAKSAVITMIAKFPAYTPVRCFKNGGRIPKRIKLARPVFGLALYDGSTSPPRRRWPPPQQRQPGQ